MSARRSRSTSSDEEDQNTKRVYRELDHVRNELSNEKELTNSLRNSVKYRTDELAVSQQAESELKEACITLQEWREKKDKKFQQVRSRLAKEQARHIATKGKLKQLQLKHIPPRKPEKPEGVPGWRKEFEKERDEHEKTKAALEKIKEETKWWEGYRE